jgi:hypothetical protein
MVILSQQLVEWHPLFPEPRDETAERSHEGLRGGYASAKQNFQPHKTKNYCGYRSWNYH